MAVAPDGHQRDQAFGEVAVGRVHVGIDRAGLHVVDGDAPWAEVAGQAFGQADQGRLAHGVGAAAGKGMRSALVLPMLMMREPSPMCRAASWVATNTLRMLMARVRSKSSSLKSSSGPTARTPALLTRMSRRPKVSTVLSTAWRMAAASALSARIASLAAGLGDAVLQGLGLGSGADVGEGDSGAFGCQALHDGGADAAGTALNQGYFAAEGLGGHVVLQKVQGGLPCGWSRVSTSD